MIERPYFTAAIGVILTVGALWGVILLLRIALHGSFTSVGIHEVNAHGHAQIFGWVGLFVMGFAYRVFPLLAGRPLPWPRIAAVAWLAMLAGVALRSGLQPFAHAEPCLLLPAHGGSGLEIAAVLAFTVQMLVLLRGGGRDLPAGPLWLVRAGLLFFLVQTIASAVYFHLTAVAAERDALLWLISTFQPALRDMQIHGFATLMVLGVGALMLPRWFGTRALPERGALIAGIVLTLAVAGEVTGFLGMRIVGTQWAGLWGLSALAMLGAAAWIVVRSRILPGYTIRSRAGKFVRMAHGWLLLSLAMLVLLPVWQFLALPRLAPGSDAVAMGFSHAYYGAIRHAITVGFLSLMILGMSVRFMERLTGGEGLPSGGLLVAFLLVNIGCAMRVGFQLLTDVHPMAFPFAGVSGVLELTGIAIWAVWMLRAMHGVRARDEAAGGRLLAPVAA